MVNILTYKYDINVSTAYVEEENVRQNNVCGKTTVNGLHS